MILSGIRDRCSRLAAIAVTRRSLVASLAPPAPGPPRPEGLVVSMILARAISFSTWCCSCWRRATAIRDRCHGTSDTRTAIRDRCTSSRCDRRYPALSCRLAPVRLTVKPCLRRDRSDRRDHPPPVLCRPPSLFLSLGSIEAAPDIEAAPEQSQHRSGARSGLTSVRNMAHNL